MASNQRRVPRMHGNGEVAVSRYFALYLAWIGWAALGAYLLIYAYWPSTCQPDGFVKMYECSMRLADQRGWVESSLMTWLWSTPLLLALELMRHYNRIRAAR